MSDYTKEEFKEFKRWKKARDKEKKENECFVHLTPEEFKLVTGQPSVLVKPISKEVAHEKVALKETILSQEEYDRYQQEMEKYKQAVIDLKEHQEQVRQIKLRLKEKYGDKVKLYREVSFSTYDKNRKNDLLNKYHLDEYLRTHIAAFARLFAGDLVSYDFKKYNRCLRTKEKTAPEQFEKYYELYESVCMMFSLIYKYYKEDKQ